jgi:hypothetical protein
MRTVDVVGAIPVYKGPSTGKKLGDPTPVISTSDVLTVEMFLCPDCRFLEFHAG